MAKKKQRINLIDRNGNSQVVEVNSTVSETPSKEAKKSTVSSAIRGGINKAKSDARNYGPLVTVANTVNGLGLGATGSNLNKKDNKDHNLLDNALQVGKNVRAGVQSGLMSIPDSQLYEIRNSLQKGEKKAKETTNAKDSTKELLKSGGKALLYTLSPTLGQAVDNLSGNKEYNEDDNAFQRALKSANNTYNVLGGTRGLGKTVEATGQLYAENQERQGKNDKLSSKVEDFQETIDKPAEDYAQQVQLENQNYSKPVQFLGNTGQTVGNMIPSMVVSAATKNPNAGLTTMFLQSKGSATKEALQNGADLDEANAIGTAKGGLEVGTEKLFGGIQLKGKSVFGKGSLDDVIENNVNRFVKNKAANWLVKQIGVNNLGEVAEETISDVVGTFIDKYTTNPNASYSAKDFGNTVGQTIASTLVLNLLGGSFGKSSYNQNLQSMAETQVADIQNRVDRGLMSQEDGARAIEQITNEINDNAQGNNEDIIPVEEMQEALANTTPEDIQQAVTTAIDTINKKVQEGKMDAQQGEMLTTTIQENAQDMLEQQQLIQNENGQMQFDLDNTMESKMEIVQNLNDTERAALTEVTQKLKNGEQLNEQDRAIIGAINAKQENVETTPIQEETTQTNAIPQEEQNVAQNEFNEDETGRTDGLMTNDEKALEHINDMIEKLDATSNENHPKFTEKQKEELRQNALEMTQRNRDYIAKQQEKNNQQNIENQTKQENIPDKVEEQVIKIGNKEVKSTDKESKLEKELTPEELRDLKIKEVKENLEAEYDEENIPKILKNTELAKEKTPTKEKIKNLETIGKMLYGKVVDKGEALAEIGRKTGNKELYPTYDKSLLYRGIAQYQIGNAQTDSNGTPFTNFKDKKGRNVSMSWEGIYKDANKANINDNVLDEYLVAQLNIDRLNQGINQFNIPESVSQETITRLEQEHPEIKRVAENVYTYSRNRLNKMVESGLVSQETADEFTQKFPHYVRIQRDVKKGKESLVYDKHGKVSVDSGIQRVKGGSYDILPIKETAANYEIQLEKAMGLNAVGLQLEKSLATPVDSNGKINKISENGELLDFDPNEDTILGDAVAKGADGNYTFTIWMDGAPVRLQIDARIYEALKTNRQSWLEQKITQPTLGRISSIQRALLTDKNPVFLATNFLKDIGDAPLNSKYGTAEFFKNYGVAMNEMRKGTKSKLWQLYLANGGLQNSYFENMKFNDTGKNKVQRKVSALAESISKANNVIEQLPRFAEFITTLNHGGSLNEAMYNSAEITTNFKRGGNVTKALNRNGFNFLNASVQGFDKQVRNFAQIGTNRKAFVHYLAKATILGIAPALVNDLIYDDDDEYKELQDYVKDQYYLIKGKDGVWIRIPKGRVMSIFGAAARRTKELATGNKDSFKDFGQLVSNQIAPNNPLDNNILSPFIAVSNNKAWSGNTIVSDYEMKNYAPEDQYDNSTDKFSIWLGKKLKKSPKMINYLLDQYTGGIGDFALPALSNEANNNVVRDKFTTDAVMKNKTTGEFYNALYDASKAKNKLKKAGKDNTDEYQEKNKVYSYLYSTSLAINELRSKQDEIEGNDSLSKKEKYEQVKEVQKEINKELREAIKNSKDVERTEEYIRVGDTYYDKKIKKDGTTEYRKRIKKNKKEVIK